MAPKEKAKELVYKYTTVLSLSFSKEFALIAVSEIIEAMKKVEVRNPYNAYWYEVKQELNKL